MMNANEVTKNLFNEFFGVTESANNIDLFDQYFSESDDVKIVPNDIEPMVKKLENKGYKVKYSSPGYSNTRFDNDKNGDGVINSKLVSTARIIFERNYRFDNTPQGWEWKVLENQAKALYVKPYTYNEDQGSKKDAFNKWQKFYLSTLSEWIDKLPQVGKEIKDENDPAGDENFSSK